MTNKLLVDAYLFCKMSNLKLPRFYFHFDIGTQHFQASQKYPYSQTQLLSKEIIFSNDNKLMRHPYI